MWNLEKDELWFLMKCYNEYINNVAENGGYPCCLEEFYYNDYKECYQDYLELLWEELGMIATDENDNIIEDFYIWKRGTFREEIWHWFDKRVSGGIGNKFFN